MEIFRVGEDYSSGRKNFTIFLNLIADILFKKVSLREHYLVKPICGKRSHSNLLGFLPDNGSIGIS